MRFRILRACGGRQERQRQQQEFRQGPALLSFLGTAPVPEKPGHTFICGGGGGAGSKGREGGSVGGVFGAYTTGERPPSTLVAVPVM